MVYYEGGYNFYGEEGCCLTCPDSHEGCLCYECKCRQCSQYTREVIDEYDGIKVVSHEGYCVVSFEQKQRWERIFIEIDAWLKETKKAYLVVIDGEEVWCPKSLSNIYNKDNKTFISLPMWLAVEKGLSEYD